MVPFYSSGNPITLALPLQICLGKGTLLRSAIAFRSRVQYNSVILE
jgi:hypothetical protein